MTPLLLSVLWLVVGIFVFVLYAVVGHRRARTLKDDVLVMAGMLTFAFAWFLVMLVMVFVHTLLSGESRLLVTINDFGEGWPEVALLMLLLALTLSVSVRALRGVGR